MNRLLALFAALWTLVPPMATPQAAAPPPTVWTPTVDEPRSTREAREAMVRTQIEARGIRDRRVLAAMREVPRHLFVPEADRRLAYGDYPLAIGRGQTISQPYIVAAMAEALALQPTDRVLEVGSGSGYAAAVLSRLAGEVYGIELEQELYERSAATLAALGVRGVQLRRGDGFRGWPERAPFDAILLSCAAPQIPPPLWEQLKVGGRLLYPQGEAWSNQELVLVVKTPRGPDVRRLEPVRFVPLRREQ